MVASNVDTEAEDSTIPEEGDDNSASNEDGAVPEEGDDSASNEDGAVSDEEGDDDASDQHSFATFVPSPPAACKDNNPSFSFTPGMFEDHAEQHNGSFELFSGSFDAAIQDFTGLGTPAFSPSADEEKSSGGSTAEASKGKNSTIDLSQLKRDLHDDIEEAAEFGITVSPPRDSAGASAGGSDELPRDDTEEEDAPLLGTAAGSHGRAVTPSNFKKNLTVDTSDTMASINPALKSLERVKNRVAGMFRASPDTDADDNQSQQTRKSSRKPPKPSTPFVSFVNSFKSKKG